MYRYIQKSVLILFTLGIMFQIAWTPSVEAVEPWKGNSWKGESWEGTPWDASDFIWEGVPWEGSDSQHEGTHTQGAEVSEVEDRKLNNDIEELCLPDPTNDDCDENDALHKVTDEKVDEAIDLYLKEHPYMLLPDSPFFREQRKEQIERLKQQYKTLTDRPHGTVGEINIADNIIANIAFSAYSDNHLGGSKKDTDRMLDEHGWKEKHNIFDGSGFHARTYENKEDHTIVVAFGGTEMELKDYASDAAIAFGYNMEQYDEAIDYVDDMMKRYPDHKIVVTGHSLGGALAQYTSINTQIPAVTFNSPGIKTRDYGFWEHPLSIWMSNNAMEPLTMHLNQNGFLNNLIENHVMENDEIGTYHIHAGKTYVYSGDGLSSVHDDYSEEAHKRDTLFGKVTRMIKDIVDGVPNHGMGNFFDIMIVC
ncbi:Mbeg1-like protein [Lentibacillus saliphilus]|uniref:Mbeg1-like protein n=1 Tax=Lentibacillus saliphilus TaxID=2737028 RepID=UPI001C30F7A5